MTSTSSAGKASQAGTSPVKNPVDGWQQKCSSFAELGKILLDKRHLSDVELRGDRFTTWFCDNVKAHKLILAGNSPIFEKMLFGSQRSSDPVSIVRVEAEKAVVEVLLKFMYGSDQSGLLTMANAFQVLRASEKYKVYIGISRCEAWIKENMNATNCLTWLMTAEESQGTNSQTAVKDHCWKYVDESAAEVFRCPKFLEIDRNLLTNILKRNSLRANEVTVYEAAMTWASSSCKREGRSDSGTNKRTALGNAVYQIRFTLMSAKEFHEGPVKSELLSLDEVSSITLHIVTDKKPILAFVTVPRVVTVPSGTFKVERFGSTYGKRMYFYDNAIDSVRFSVDRDIILLGCEIYTSGKDRYTVKVKVFTGANEDDPVHQETVTGLPLSCKLIMGPACVAEVEFSKELPIRCSTQCIIQCDIHGKESDYGITGKREATTKVTLDNGSSILYGFSFSPDPAQEKFIRTSTSSGQIPTILFRP